MNYTKAVFSVDGLNGKFEGWTDGTTWNGWETPSFTRDVMNDIYDECLRNGYTAEFNGETKNHELTFEDGTVELIERHRLTIDGKKGKEMFFISGWTWERVN